MDLIQDLSGQVVRALTGSIDAAGDARFYLATPFF